MNKLEETAAAVIGSAWGLSIYVLHRIGAERLARRISRGLPQWWT